MLSRKPLVALLFVLAFGLAGCTRQAAVATAIDAPTLQTPRTQINVAQQERQAALGVRHLGEYVNGNRSGVAKNTITRNEQGQYVATQTFASYFVFDGKDERYSNASTTVLEGHAPFRFVRFEKTSNTGRGAPHHVVIARGRDGWTETTTRGEFTHVKPMKEPDYTFDDFIGQDVWLSRPHKVGDSVVLGGFEHAVRVTVTGVHADGLTFDEVDIHGNRRSGKVKGKESWSLANGAWQLRLEQADLDPRGLVGVALPSTVRIPSQLGDVRAIDSLRLRVTGKNAALIVPGPGQVVEKVDGGVLLTLSSKAPPVRATKEEIESSLEDTFDTPHQHPAVRELMQQIVGDQKLSRRETARRMIEYIEKNMPYDSDAEPNSVIDLIRDKRGVCRHFAALLTTMLRAADIPARYVTGLAGGGDDTFGMHAWTELVLEDGTWLAVDPTFGQLKTTSHIRLPQNESGDVMTFELDKLRIEIVNAGNDSSIPRYGWWLGGAVVVVIVGRAILCRENPTTHEWRSGPFRTV